MAAYKAAVGMVLTEIVDSDDEKPKKPRRRKTMECIKRRESDYFEHIFQEFKVEHQFWIFLVAVSYIVKGCYSAFSVKVAWNFQKI